MIKLYHGDVIEVLNKLPEKSVQMCVTSPPYWAMRDYGPKGQVGHENSVKDYVQKMVDVGRALWRVLRDDGVYYLNLGDGYSSAAGKYGRSDNPEFMTAAKLYKAGNLDVKVDLPAKNLLGVPWRTAFALQDDKWVLRTDIIWEKASSIPEPVKDRPTRNHEYIFLLAKSQKYYYDREAGSNLERFPSLLEQGTRYQRTVWKTTHSTGAMKGCKKCQEVYTLEAYRRLASNGKVRGKFPSMSEDTRVVEEKKCSHCGASDWEAHAAPYPEKLVAPCILAGTSDKGACKSCGTCWVRDGEDWKKNCDCKSNEVRPCVVMDIFNGSGTTGIVAMRLGRSYIGIDLSKQYLEIARKRMERLAITRGIDEAVL